MADSETPLLDKFNEYPRTPSTDPAEKILFAVIGDLKGRKGIGDKWYDTDSDIQEEILQENLELIRKYLI